MNHPTNEDWMSYLYNELDDQQRRDFHRHAEQCEQCRGQLAAWQRTARGLEFYQTTARNRQSSSVAWWRPWLRWTAAAAALVLVAAGFALGRVSGAPRSEVAALRDQLAVLNADVQARAETIARTETQRQLRQFASEVNGQVRALQAQHAGDYASLRRELETVAVLTEAGFNRTENQLVQLAGYDGNARATESPR